MTKLKAILFDLHGTIAYLENPISEIEVSDYLFSKGYEISPQQLKATWFFVAMVDYPKYGHKSWHSYLSRIFWRLETKVNKETLDSIVKLFQSSSYHLYPDGIDAVINAKNNGFKTAIVTTIASFQFKKAIRPIRNYLDLIVTGYEARCDKSNPKIYKKTLELLGINPNEAVMIGDNVYVDIFLPKKLGIHAILLNRCKKNVECEQAEAVVSNLSQALEIAITYFA
ncbi:MAG: HAD family hydrolase [Thaumarchaeota archaeon]|jgi:HAD superfamily hydrolase (TIGR01549 family)|nr:HAD family hydrolase [Nitrososphaerota archaeon]